jgi:hypothetical protein
VALFRASKHLEPLRDFVEALVASCTREPGIHLRIPIGLAGDRGPQVVGRRPDGFARDRVADLGEKVEVPERIAGLTLRDRAEQGGEIRIALHVGLLREVEVAPVRLARARERSLEVLMGLCSLELWHHRLPLSWVCGLLELTRSDGQGC